MSTVLGGQTLTYVMSNGAYGSGWIYADGNPIGRTSSVSPNWWEIHSPVNSDMIRISQGHVERDSEFSPIGDNVGTENPYLNGGGDGSMGYPSGGGDASNMKCAIDGNEADCSSVFKFAFRRNFAFLITRIIEQRFSSVVEQTSSQLVPGGSHAGNTILGERFAYQEVIAEPDRFDTTTVGAFEETVGLRTTESELVPQNTGVRLGSTDQARKLLEQTSSSCRSAIQKLYSEIAAETGSEFISTDPLELFKRITSQTAGGGIYVDISHPTMSDSLPADAMLAYNRNGGGSSGSGESWTFWSYSQKAPQRLSVIYLRYSDGSPQSTGLAMAGYVVTLFHEMAHIARKDWDYVSHGQMDKAARTLEHVADFDDYVEKHCVDKKYWGHP